MNFDHLMGKAKQAVSAATQKTEKVVSTSKLKIESGKVSGEIKNTYEKLGKTFYEMRNSDQPDEQLIMSLCEEIDELFLREKNLKQEIATISNNGVVCKECAHPNGKESTFCNNCGAKMETIIQPEPKIASSTLICVACGYENSSENVFCTNCGVKLAPVISASEAMPVSEVPPASDSETPSTDDPPKMEKEEPVQ